MIHVMNLKVVVTRLILFTIAVSVVIYFCMARWINPDLSASKIIDIASIVATVAIALSASATVWRPAWRFLSKLDATTYPDLNGIWEGTIQPGSPSATNSSGSLTIKAQIRQSMMEIFIDFHGKDFTSATNTATPRIQNGQHYLYYTYTSESKDPERPPYSGTAILRVQAAGLAEDRHLILSGTYYTTRKTVGRIHLKQVAKDPDQAKEASYYHNDT